MADLRGDEGVLRDWPPPYAALVWIMAHAPEGAFMGNPVRHFQHLATRVSGPRAEQRSWRAWACFLLAQRMLPSGEFPPDEAQIESEGLVLPEFETVNEALERLGWQGEAAEFDRVMAGLAL